VEPILLIRHIDVDLSLLGVENENAIEILRFGIKGVDGKIHVQAKYTPCRSWFIFMKIFSGVLG